MRPGIRDARETPAVLHVVDPRGRIRACAFGEGIGHAMVDSRGHLRASARDRGCIELEQLYAVEGPAGGMAVFLDFERVSRTGRVAVLPDGWLPPTVLARRTAAAQTDVWAPPPVPSVAPRSARA